VIVKLILSRGPEALAFSNKEATNMKKLMFAVLVLAPTTALAWGTAEYDWGGLSSGSNQNTADAVQCAMSNYGHVMCQQSTPTYALCQWTDGYVQGGVVALSGSINPSSRFNGNMTLPDGSLWATVSYTTGNVFRTYNYTWNAQNNPTATCTITAVKRYAVAHWSGPPVP
jgi:hypothetical protein